MDVLIYSFECFIPLEPLICGVLVGHVSLELIINIINRVGVLVETLECLASSI